MRRKFTDGITSLADLGGVRSHTPASLMNPGTPGGVPPDPANYGQAAWMHGGSVGLPGNEDFRPILGVNPANAGMMRDPARLGNPNPAALGMPGGGINPLLGAVPNPSMLLFGDAMRDKFSADHLTNLATLLKNLRTRIVGPSSIY